MTWWPINLVDEGFRVFELLHLELECFYLSMVLSSNFLNQIGAVQSFFMVSVSLGLGILFFFYGEPTRIRKFVRGRNW